MNLQKEVDYALLRIVMMQFGHGPPAQGTVAESSLAQPNPISLSYISPLPWVDVTFERPDEASDQSCG